MTIDGTAATVDSIEVLLTPNSIALVLASADTVSAGETVTVALAEGGVLDDAGNDNAALAATSVTNNSLVSPTVTEVALTSVPGSDNTYAIGNVVEATVTFSEAVDITGTPQLELDFAGTGTTADCAAHGTDTTKLVCSHTVVESNSAPNGIAIAANKLTLNSGTIKEAGSTTVNADPDPRRRDDRLRAQGGRREADAVGRKTPRATSRRWSSPSARPSARSTTARSR